MRNRFILLTSLVMIASMLLGACQPQPSRYRQQPREAPGSCRS